MLSHTIFYSKGHPENVFRTLTVLWKRRSRKPLLYGFFFLYAVVFYYSFLIRLALGERTERREERRRESIL